MDVCKSLSLKTTATHEQLGSSESVKAIFFVIKPLITSQLSSKGGTKWKDGVSFVFVLHTRGP